MITLKVKKVSSLKDKVQGLIGLEKPYALLIKTHFGIHTFGLKFPIDILILDKNSKVVAMKKNLKPKRIFFWNPLFDMVVELPKGLIAIEKIKIGDQIKLVFD